MIFSEKSLVLQTTFGRKFELLLFCLQSIFREDFLSPSAINKRVGYGSADLVQIIWECIALPWRELGVQTLQIFSQLSLHPLPLTASPEHNKIVAFKLKTVF